jgi:uncharacterized protein YjiS (DUF1127 family)
MASRPITREGKEEAAAPHGFAASIAGKLGTVARAPRATWFKHIAASAARTIAQELHIRRDMRELMTMSDHMLKDIRLSRGGIDRTVRHGRDRRAREGAEGRKGMFPSGRRRSSCGGRSSAVKLQP